VQGNLKVEQSIFYSSKLFDQGRKEIGGLESSEEAWIWPELACDLEIGFTECWDCSCENKHCIIILDF